MLDFTVLFISKIERIINRSPVNFIMLNDSFNTRVPNIMETTSSIVDIIPTLDRFIPLAIPLKYSIYAIAEVKVPIAIDRKTESTEEKIIGISDISMNGRVNNVPNIKLYIIIVMELYFEDKNFEKTLIRE